MAANNELGKQMEGLNRRIDTLTAEVVDVKTELRTHRDLLKAMQDTQRESVNLLTTLVQRVGGVEQTQERLVVLVSRIVERLADFEAGARVELDNVDYNSEGRTLRGTIRRISR